MKTLLLLAMFAQTATVNYAYPVHVQVVSIFRQPNARGAGSGLGNVHDPTFGTRGINFAFGSGCWQFGPNINDYYAARWQSERELVIVLHAVGSDKTEECALHTTLRADATYLIGKDGKVTTRAIPAKK
jgi:hypothetical protein